MKVKELIEVLAKMPADLEVYMEQSDDKTFDKIRAAEHIHRIKQKENGGYKEESMVILKTPWYIDNN